jgi:DNA-directed RNA polymerase subunit RPC12/RpoP
MSEKAIREAVRDDIAARDIDCPGCGNASFDIDVWGVGDGINGEEVRAAVVCESCSARLNVPVDSDVVEEFL